MCSVQLCLMAMCKDGCSGALLCLVYSPFLGIYRDGVLSYFFLQ